MNPTIFDILLGRHYYGMDPDTETWWCRACLAIGFLGGMFTCLMIIDKIAGR